MSTQYECFFILQINVYFKMKKWALFGVIEIITIGGTIYYFFKNNSDQKVQPIAYTSSLSSNAENKKAVKAALYAREKSFGQQIKSYIIKTAGWKFSF
jgi:hypothetical protein